MICGGGSEELMTVMPAHQVIPHRMVMRFIVEGLSSQRAAQAYLVTYDKNPDRAVAMNMRLLRLLQR